MNYARVISTGSYLPEKILTNHDIAEMVDTSHEWIVERSGIHSRHIIGERETASTMAYNASLDAIKNAGISAKEIDLIIVATVTAEQIIPNVACLLQSQLGLPGIPAFDLSAACAGFIYALSTAEQYIRSGAAKTVLIVGSEAMSMITDWTDRKTCILFGDGAGAIILRADQKPGVLSSHIHADGGYRDLMYLKNGLPGLKTNMPPYVYMEGKEVFKFAVNTLGSIVEETLSANCIEPDAIDWLVPHQANLRIISAVAKKLSLPMEKVIVTIEHHGNTSAASIPLALDQGIKDGRIKAGHNIIIEAIGGGFAWGSALIRM